MLTKLHLHEKDVVKMAKTTLIINEKLPGLNQIVDAAKRGHREYSSMKKHYTNLVIRELIKQKCVPAKPYSKIVVNYEFHEGTNARDPDNQLSGIKFVHDAFVSCGMVTDDDTFHIEFGRIESIIDGKFSVIVKWTIEE